MCVNLRRGISGQLQLIVTSGRSNQCVVSSLVAVAPHEIELGLYTYTHTCVYTYTCVCIYIYMYVHKDFQTCAHIYVCVGKHACMRL